MKPRQSHDALISRSCQTLTDYNLSCPHGVVSQCLYASGWPVLDLPCIEACPGSDLRTSFQGRSVTHQSVQPSPTRRPRPCCDAVRREVFRRTRPPFCVVSIYVHPGPCAVINRTQSTDYHYRFALRARDGDVADCMRPHRAPSDDRAAKFVRPRGHEPFNSIRAGDAMATDIEIIHARRRLLI